MSLLRRFRPKPVKVSISKPKPPGKWKHWTPMEETQLQILCARKPRLTWKQIAAEMPGRTKAACQQRATALGFRETTIIYEPCDYDGKRRRFARPDCHCAPCERKRESRRARSRFKCAHCAGANIIVGSGAHVKVYRDGEDPGADGLPPHTRLRKGSE